MPLLSGKRRTEYAVKPSHACCGSLHSSGVYASGSYQAHEERNLPRPREHVVYLCGCPLLAEKQKRGKLQRHLSEKIAKALEHLVAHGLLDSYQTDQPREGNGGQFTERAAKRQKGAAAVTGKAGSIAKKRSLSQIQADGTAEQEQRRLRLRANEFSA